MLGGRPLTTKPENNAAVRLSLKLRITSAVYYATRNTSIHREADSAASACDRDSMCATSGGMRVNPHFHLVISIGKVSGSSPARLLDQGSNLGPAD